MKVLVNGAGNIGTTLACLLFDFKTELKITEVLIYKNTPQPWLNINLDFLINKGITVITSKTTSYPKLIKSVDYIFETTANGIGNSFKTLYKNTKNLKGVCAQGSEKGFGIPFMSALKNESIKGEKFVQIVSCNTHGAASLLSSICGNDLKNLSKSDFVVVRRYEDLGNHERLVTANVVARHLSDKIGTHHAIDVKDMFNSINIKCNITSSDITTPSQLMHATRFNIETKEPVSNTEICKLLNANSFIATTNKFDSNTIFELGRRYGKYGRIYSHAIVLTNNLLIQDKTIKGWAFIPQEGNSILSTIHAYLLQTQAVKSNKIIELIKNNLLNKSW